MGRKLRELTENEVTFTFELEPDETPFEGNVLASGDDEADREQEAWTRDELDRGNVAAWCVAIVRVTWKEYGACDVLGGCSYRSERELWADLAGTMKSEALDRLNETVRSHAQTLLSLVDS